MANATKTAITIAGATTFRPWIFDGWFTCSATPADVAILWYAQRSTASGTSTADTPSALDPGDPASLATVGVNHTVEPTYTAGAILWHGSVNQRSVLRMQLDPDAPLMIPATANNGIGFYPVNASATPTVDFCLHHAD